MDEARVAGAFSEAVVTEGGGGEGRVCGDCCDLIHSRGRSEGCRLWVGGWVFSGGTVGGHFVSVSFASDLEKDWWTVSRSNNAGGSFWESNKFMSLQQKICERALISTLGSSRTVPN